MVFCSKTNQAKSLKFNKNLIIIKNNVKHVFKFQNEKSKANLTLTSNTLVKIGIFKHMEKKRIGLIN